MAQNINLEIVKKTSQLLYDQCNNQLETVLRQLADGIVWIGPMDFQWAEDLAASKEILLPDHNKIPPLFTEEEYHLLTHSKDIWIVYGRFLLTLTASDNSMYRTRIRVTAVWRRVKHEVKAIHMHVSASKDAPAGQPLTYRSGENLSDYIAQYLTPVKNKNICQQKLVLKDCSGCYHYLYEPEILGIEADKQYSHLFLSGQDIRVRKQISEFENELSSAFIRVHRSFLVNLSHISDIWLYHIRLSNGRELPVSREKYSFLKKLLEKKK